MRWSRSEAARAATATLVVLALTLAASAAGANALTAAFLYFLGVLLAATFGVLAAAAAAVAATACLNFFFLPPLGSLHLADSANWFALAAFLVAGGLTSHLVSRAREEARLARERAQGLKDLLEERERAEALRRSDRLREALLRAVSHDLASPLTAMGFEIDTLRRELSGLPAAATVEELGRQHARLRRRIEDLLALGRLEAGAVAPRPEPPPPADLFRSARESLAPWRRPVIIQVEPNCPDLLVDPSLALEIIVNLMENADRASPEGTAIQLVAGRDGDGVRLGILDRGHGVPGLAPGEVVGAGQLATGGLGLDIASRFAKACGGQVRLEAGAVEGITAWVTLPAAAELVDA